ncbi:hypothetical protein [uncultured Thermosynechococcus sp.]|uniref:hypothetical protein n=1 Tax=uncultured Thermosynechococcus sp. TaxID=436945 RepID=UPI0026354E51|nr:hypothetical protein [uncultured Thermosynechococcus sp.]
MAPWLAELMWLFAVFGVSLLIALGIKLIAPLYPLPPHLGVILLLVVSPALLMAILLIKLSQSDSQNPAP